jgi:hypothetical protein
MQLTVTWNNPDNVLLRRMSGGVEVNGGGEVPLTVGTGRATTTVTDPFPLDLSLRIQFQADLGTNPTVLGIVQRVQMASDLRVTAQGYRVLDVDNPTGPVVDVAGQHPMIGLVPLPGALRVTVEARVVNVTALVPRGVVTTSPGTTVDLVAAVANGTMVRYLARTDGRDPTFWITCTPKACRRAPATDVLCMLTPPKDTLPTNLSTHLTPGSTESNDLVSRRAVFLGQGVDSLVPPPTSARDHQAWFLDHCTSAGAGVPNFVLARGWEQALVDSGRHVSLVLPVPADGKHNEAAGKALPGLLEDVHRTLQAIGDVTPPTGVTLGKPQFAVGCHSIASADAFQALGAAPRAYSDAFLMEPTVIGANLAVLRTSSARICLIGFTRELVGKPLADLKAMPGVAGRVRIVPKNYPDDRPDKAPIPLIVNRSPDVAALRNPRALKHALSPLLTPPLLEWEPRVLVGSGGRKLFERFEMLHQYAVYGGDDEGTLQPQRHFLTQALLGSSLR